MARTEDHGLKDSAESQRYMTRQFFGSDPANPLNERSGSLAFSPRMRRHL